MNWLNVALADLGMPSTEKIEPSQFPDELFELYSVPSFSNGLPEIVKGAEIKSSKQCVQPGDVLLCKIVPHLNRVWTVAPVSARRQIASTEWIVVRSPECKSSYLCYALTSPFFRTLFLEEVSGVGGSLMRARPAGVAQIEVPLAPADEQHRIVTKIDSLFARSSRARDELAHIPKLIERYRQAVLEGAFKDCTTSPAPLDDVVESTFYGPRIASEAYVDDGIPTLRTTDIGSYGRLAPKSPPKVNVSGDELMKWGFQDGDLMVTRTGATIGKCALYEETFGPALPSAYLIRVRLRKKIADPKYVLLFLLSPSGQKQLLAGRTAVAQPNINATAICSLRLPIPELAVQRQIVQKAEAFISAIDLIFPHADGALALLGRLDQSILDKAFTGKLVPQDPADEPASKLLERIQAARVAAPKAKRGRGAKGARDHGQS
ncbi:MAG: type I restriction enzyme, S subunit [Stygiobacter sp.]|nr:MAG: type I restriction enzyme, S subunit [Stygiobacter sp.]